METKNFANAIADFVKAVELNPNSIFGHFNLGIAYYNTGNKDMAVESFKNAARLGDEDSQQWLKSNGYNW